MSEGPPGYRVERIGSARAVVQEHARSFVRQAIEAAGTLYRFAELHENRETIRGRGMLYVIPGPDGLSKWVVRHLSHGGLLAPVTRDRFLRVGTPRPLNELGISLELRHRGIPTPEVIAAVVYPHGLFYRGDVARRWVPRARDLADCLFAEPRLDDADRIAACATAGRLLRWLHHAGVVHPDLNARNVLLEWSGRPPRPYVLDLEKCRIVDRVSPRQRRRMLARFERSIRKFERSQGPPLSDHEWECLRTAYAEYHEPDDHREPERVGG